MTNDGDLDPSTGENVSSTTVRSHGNYRPAIRPWMQILRVAIQCFSALILLVLILSVFAHLTHFQTDHWMALPALFAAIHFSAWRYSARIGSRLAGVDLVWLAVGCFMAFYAFDTGFPALLRATGLASKYPDRSVVDIILTPFISAAIVAALVFLTVPIGQKIYGRAQVA